MMNTMNNNEQAMTQAQAMTTLTEAVTTMAVQLKELVDLAKAESTVATATTTTTATTATEATETTTVGYLPCPTDAKTAEAAEDVAQKITDETAAEANAVVDTEKMLDDIIADISALYNISSYALSNEGKNIESDKSPYAPKENKMGVIGDYQVFISKEITKDGDHIEGSFRLIIKDRSIVSPIMDHSLTIVNGHIKVYSSDNTLRMEKIKESNALMRFLEITDEISALVMSKYISD